MSAEALGLECAVIDGWKFARFTEGQFAEFSVWAKQMAINEVSEMRSAFEPYAYRDMIAAVIADAAAGAYRWGHFGPGFGILRMLNSTDGVEKATMMALHKFHPDVTIDQVRKLLASRAEEVAAAIREVVTVPPS